MTDCFISYKSEDRDRVERVVAALRDAGYSVWWDVDLGGGHRCPNSIAEKLDSSRCVLVCWSANSVSWGGDYVREEAERAKRRGVLLPLLLDPVPPPVGSDEIQALDLVGWDGRTKSHNWQAVLRGVQAILERKQQAPMSLAPLAPKRSGVVAAAVSVLVVAIGLWADLLGLRATLCRPEGGMSSLCARMGFGPNSNEVVAWTEAKSAATSGPLKAYLAKYSTGFFAAEAQARLAACRTAVDVSWMPYIWTAPLVVPSGPIRAAPTEAAAREAMQREVQRDADDACSAAPLSELYRPVPNAGPVVPTPEGWDCRSAVDGWRCRYDGKIVCPQERRRTVEREVCTPG